MKIFFINEQAFLELKPGSNYMICIGTKKEVEDADEASLMAMVEQALAISEYNSIDCKRVVRH